MLNNIEIPTGWHNIHSNAYLASQGIEPGDQLLVTVLTAVERLHFGDLDPTSDSGYVRVEQDESIITQEGVDCWVLGPATLQVEYAP